MTSHCLYDIIHNISATIQCWSYWKQQDFSQVLHFSLTLYKSLIYLQQIFHIESENCMPKSNNNFCLSFICFQFVELCSSSRYRFLRLLIKCEQWNRRWHKESFPVLQIEHPVEVSFLLLYVEYTFIYMRRRVSTSLTTGFLIRSIYTLLWKVVFNFFNSMNLLEFSILDLHDCIYWSFSRCFSTTWKLLLAPGGSNQIFLKPFWVRQWYIPCSQLWFSVQTVSKAAFNGTLAVLWTRRSQYFTAIAHTLFIIGNLTSSPRTAVLLAYLLTFNDFLQYNDWGLSICTGVLPVKSDNLYERVLRRIISLYCICFNLIIILL